ncbi:hypothetical protein Tco_0754284 [Tanacetum coccineum]
MDQQVDDVKARSLLLMALPSEHQLTFSQYLDAKTMFAAIEIRFGGVVISQEDLNSKILSSLPPEWNTHVVVWMNKPEIETMSIDDLYNNFKIVEQKFSTASPDVNIASPQVSTASFSDNVVYAFMVENPNISNLLHQDLEQIHEDDLEAMDLKLGTLCQEVEEHQEARKSDMVEKQVQTNMALMAFSDSEFRPTSSFKSILDLKSLICSYSGLENAKSMNSKGIVLRASHRKVSVLGLKHVKRGWDTKIPQSSGPPVKVGDEAVHKELGDRIERAATTASSLEAEQDSGNIK